MVVLPTHEGYDRWSEIYDQELNPLVHLEEPHVARLLGDVNGMRILDVGCGTGRHAVRLAKQGAIVTGLDFSRGMLEKARAKPGAGSISFLHHDAGRPLPVESESFDRVVSCLVLDHVADVRGFFAELRRACAPGGFIVASVMHPAMMLKGVQARFQDPGSGEEVRPESVANLLSDYVMGALDASLRFEELSEHSVDEALAASAPRAQKYLGWPMLLLMKLTR